MVREDLPPEDSDYIELFPDLFFEETPLVQPIPLTPDAMPRCTEPAIRSTITIPTSRPKAEQGPTPEAIYQRKRHFRPPAKRSENQKTSTHSLSHPPVFIPVRGKLPPPLPGYRVQNFVPRRRRTLPTQIPTNPRTAETRIVGLQKPPTARPLMNFNVHRLKKVVQHIRNMR